MRMAEMCIFSYCPDSSFPVDDLTITRILNERCVFASPLVQPANVTEHSTVSNYGKALKSNTSSLSKNPSLNQV